MIVTANLGRDLAAVGALAALAERYAIPVAQPHASCVNLPASHPMNLGHAGTELVAKADVIIVAECEVPWYPRYVDAARRREGRAPRRRSALRALPDPLVPRARSSMPGNTRTALELLDAALARREREPKRRRSDAARFDRGAQGRAGTRGGDTARDGARREADPLRVPRRLPARRAAEEVDVVIELGVPPDALQLEEPGSLLGVSIGGGLGFGLGASLGAKLAAPDRMVVSTVGDGSYMFGNPTPFHLVSRAANLPTLTIVCNNGRWQAVDSATRVVYPHGLAAAAQPMPLVELQPSPEFTKVAEASDAWARRVDEPADVPRATRGSARGRRRRPAGSARRADGARRPLGRSVLRSIPAAQRSSDVAARARRSNQSSRPPDSAASRASSRRSGVPTSIQTPS